MSMKLIRIMLAQAGKFQFELISNRNAWNRMLWIYQCSYHLSKSPTDWGLVHCADAVIFWVGVCNCNWHPPPNWCTKCGSFFLEIYGMAKLSWFSTRYTIHKRWLADFSIQKMGYSKSAIKPELLTILLIYLNSLLLRAKTSEELFVYFITSWCIH